MDSVDLEITRDKAKNLLGVAKIPLASLSFEKAIAEKNHREPCARKITQLVTLFENGCRRYDEDNYITAQIVSQESLLEALTRVSPPLNGLQAWKESAAIPFLDINEVQCLHGLHRKLAADEFLQGNDRWWTVRLYSENLEENSIANIVNGHTLARTPTDGEILWNIMKLQLRPFDRDIENERLQWQCLLSEAKQKDLKQLLKNPVLKSAFESLLPYKGLWRSIRMGTFHRLLTLKCDEELARYLYHIQSTWSILTQRCSPDLITSNTCEALQSLAPGVSDSDYKLAEVALEDLPIEPRKSVIDACRTLECSIPTFWTFFEALKYLEPCCEVLRTLLDRKKSNTIYQAARMSYIQPSEGIPVDQGGQQVVYLSSTNPDEVFWNCYVQLWLFAARYFSQLTNTGPRKVNGEDKPRDDGVNPISWHAFAKTATDLGFCSQTALRIKSQDPVHDSVSQLFAKFGGLKETHRITKVVHEVTPIVRHAHLSSFCSPQSLVCPGISLPIERRNGRPFQDDYLRDRSHLSLPLLYGCPPSYSEDEHSNITTLFAKRDMLLAFLGKPSSQHSFTPLTEATNVQQFHDLMEDVEVDPSPDTFQIERTRLCREIELLTADNAVLRSEKASWESERTRLLQDISSCKSENTALESKYQSVLSEKMRLDGENEQLRSHQETATSDNTALSSTYKDVLSKNIRLDQENKQLRAQQKSSALATEALKAEVDVYRSEERMSRTYWEREEVELREELAELRRKNRELETKKRKRSRSPLRTYAPKQSDSPEMRIKPNHLRFSQENILKLLKPSSTDEIFIIRFQNRNPLVDRILRGSESINNILKQHYDDSIKNDLETWITIENTQQKVTRLDQFASVMSNVSRVAWMLERELVKSLPVHDQTEDMEIEL